MLGDGINREVIPFTGAYETLSTSSPWSWEENKLFEKALVEFPEETPQRWVLIASRIPGKSVQDLLIQYHMLRKDVDAIEAGATDLPVYPDDEEMNDLEKQVSSNWMQMNNSGCSWSSETNKNETNKRKRGNPWTEEEHKLFLKGLEEYGKGDWRGISRSAVKTRTPSQVASHAQKYFLRLEAKQKNLKPPKRKSIHDITEY
ncbi:hypothetical protein J5N97_024870 [Dioscorea zingiberensis]|uniref:Transcription factor MYBS1 n=1 Tax=Dioscorea zingiberensis TaxID=325984 RepID=A0A9D5H9G8_9LILI|nr:hypothetical protein J5N97_024870 [Dioscorea zingiberensis]